MKSSFGAGTLHSVIVNDVADISTMTLYDGTSTAGIVIAVLSVTAKAIVGYTMHYDMSFSTGLFVVVATNGNDYTITYE